MTAQKVESRSSRRILGHLSSGQNLLDALLAVCIEHDVRFATFSLSGVLESVALAHYDPTTRSIGKGRWFKTPVQILTTTGCLSMRNGRREVKLTTVVSRLGDNGIDVFGGIIDAATVMSVEYIIEALDDVIVEGAVDRKTGLASWAELTSRMTGAKETRATDPRPPAEAPVVAAPLPTQTLPPLHAGDLLDHHKFGRCTIEKVDSNEEFASVRLRNSRLIRLNIDALNLRYLNEEKGHQVFASDSPLA